MSPERPDPADSDPGYEVGYGRPPLATRFRPGQSGNPQGRPKGRRNLATALNAELNTRVTIQENGRKRTITKLQAAVKQLVNKAASGDPRSMQLLLGLTRAVEDATGGVPEPLSREADQQVKRDMLRRVRQLAREVGDEES